MAKIFISYSRKDTDKVDSLIKILESANHDVWVDTQDIRAGSQWQTSIVQAIVESDFFILALSKNSAKSDNVRRELVIAVNHKKEIIPVCIQEVELPPEMQYQLAGIQRINFDKDSQKDRTALLSVLDKEGSDVQRKLTQPQAQTSIKNKVLWIVLSLSILVSMTIVITLFVRGFEDKTKEIEIVNISVKENISSSSVELDIKLMNSGDKETYLHTARVHIKDFDNFDIYGCFYQLGGGGTYIETSHSYDMDITNLEGGKYGNKPLSQYIRPKYPDRFSIILLREVDYQKWFLYKINLELVYSAEDKSVLSKPIIFISRDPMPEELIATLDSPIVTPAKFLYGYQLSDAEILERYKFILDPDFTADIKEEWDCCSSEEELILKVRGCYKENLRRVTDIFSEEDMILSEQAEVIFNEWKKVMEDTP